MCIRDRSISLETLFGKPPKTHLSFQSSSKNSSTLNLPEEITEDLLCEVLRHPTVASKGFLITIGDRSVTGLIARDQLVGPWQVPVADYGLCKTSFAGNSGEAMAIGERTPLSLISSKSAAKISVAEAITNIIPSGIAIVGEKYWSVVKARKLLKVNWEKKSDPVYADSKIYRSHLDKLSKGKSSKVRKDGSPSKIFKNAKDIVQAQYYLPFQTLAAMEPCNCVVNVSDGVCEIWTGTQNPDNAITRASKVTGIPEKNIKLNLTFLGGGFGRKSFNDWIEDGVRISIIC